MKEDTNFIRLRASPLNFEEKLIFIKNLKKPKKAEKKESLFIKDFLQEINNGRLKLKKFSNKIDNLKKNFEKNIHTKEEFFIYKERIIPFKEGLLTFCEFSKFLKNLFFKNLNNKISLDEIINIEELKMPFPKDLKDWKNPDYINKQMEIIENKNKGQYKLTEFFHCRCLNDGEISALMQLINKENGIRDYVFNKEIKYIGINIKEFSEKSYLIYINFAK